MSVYSGTFAPAGSNADFALKDPIAEARELLRLAARYPFAAARAEVWRSGFRRHAASAQKALREHIACAELPDSPISRVERASPQLQQVVSRQRDEHDLLLQQTDDLLQLANEPGSPDIWRMIDLGEKAILTEMALARHHNRLSQLVLEAAQRTSNSVSAS